MAEPIGMLEGARNELGNVLGSMESNHPELLDLTVETIPDGKVFDVMNAEAASHSDHETLRIPSQDNDTSPEHMVNLENNESIVVIMRAGEQLAYQRSLISTPRQAYFDLAA